MTARVYAADIDRHLTDADHTSSTRRTTWAAGYRTAQASPYTVRIWHDGPNEQAFLAQYATVLTAAGYHVTTEPAAPAGEDESTVDRRPSIKATLR